MKRRLIAPSLLAANFGNLAKDIEMVNQSTADWLHLDIMDGVFVPNISFGFPVLKYVKKLSQKPLDMHLMIVEPDKFVPAFAQAGAAMLTVHYEACPHLHRSIQNIKNQGIKAGVVLNPHTPVSLLSDILPELDMVLLMSVNPGFGGQKFIPHTFEKIRTLRQMIEQKQSNCLIEVDGGADLSNAKELFSAGANVLVAGSAVFKAENPAETIQKMKTA